MAVKTKNQDEAPSTEIEIAFAELHNPLFLSGTNLGTKLDPTKKQGLMLKYLWNESKLLVVFNGRLAIVPDSNVANVNPKNQSDIDALLTTKIVIAAPTPAPAIVKTAGPAPMVANVSRTAQVADPTRGSFK